MDIWEEGVGARKPNCSGTIFGPRLAMLGVGLCWLGTEVQVGDLAGDCRKGKHCLIWLAIGGGVGCGW